MMQFLRYLYYFLTEFVQFSDSEVTPQSRNVTSSVSSENVWDSVKFSFEIEEVSAAVFWKETAKVTYSIA